MFSKLFRKLVDLSPSLSLTIWKYFYELSALFFKKMVNWKFMNYGYADIESTALSYDVLCGNLYRHLWNQVKLEEGKQVLEIGSGRGGGCELLLDYQPQSVTGLDFSNQAIKFCQKNYQDKRLNFVAGNAEKLPFDDNSFDVIINVESSHCYGNRAAFFKEVARTLKPSGYFLYADFMGRIHYHKRPVQLEQCGLQVLSANEITPHVLKSMQLSQPYKEELLKKLVIKPLRKSIIDFVGLPGSNIYNKFASGESIYFAIACQKPAVV
ncbi:methyltransferase domain-containing protein [Pelobium sp.]|nr:class I SAM-dependent methyltransferase [Pelobium sp.]MDA9554728.1 methyltransferase domain-containing protein [Pelobium sp.]